MNKNIFVVLMALFMVFVGFQFAEPAAAVKVVDHGTKYAFNDQNGLWEKVTWKTYQYSSNLLKVYKTFYTKNPKTKKYVVSSPRIDTITKVTKNSVKIRSWSNYEASPYTYVEYHKTKLTAAKYYWKIYRHLYIAR